MLPIILTGLAGVALGIVIMRLLSSPPVTEEQRDTDTERDATGKADENVMQAAPAFGSNKFFSRLNSLTRKQMLLGSAGAMALAAVAVLSFRSDGSNSNFAASSNTPQAGAQTGMAAPAGGLDDVDTMIKRLEERLRANPNDGEGFRMLGWSYQNTNHPAEAVKAYQQAARLLPDRSDIRAGLGEALVAISGDKVTDEAKAQFDEAVKLNPDEPRARFFQSLYKAQNGKEAAALDEWIILANSAPADQPWQIDLRKRIETLAGKLGKNVSGRLKEAAPAAADAVSMSPAGTGPDAAAIAAADKLSQGERQTMIDGMVDGLATKLKSNPGDVDGWGKLLRSRMVLKQKDQAVLDLAAARKALASDPQKLKAIEGTAKEIGL